MRTLELKQMENIAGEGCLGFAAGMIGVGVGVATSELGFGIAIAAAGLLQMAEEAGACEDQIFSKVELDNGLMPAV